MMRQAEPTELDRDLTLLAELFTTVRAGTLRDSSDVWHEVPLSMSQLKVLMSIVASGGATSRSLADQLKIGPSAVTPLVDALVEKQYARREPDADDRRVTWIRPTARGAALREKLMGAHRQSLRQIVEAIAPSDRKLVRRALELLTEAARARASRPENAR